MCSLLETPTGKCFPKGEEKVVYVYGKLKLCDSGDSDVEHDHEDGVIRGLTHTTKGENIKPTLV